VAPTSNFSPTQQALLDRLDHDHPVTLPTTAARSTTVLALRNRGLVHGERTPTGWRLALTEAGARWQRRREGTAATLTGTDSAADSRTEPQLQETAPFEHEGQLWRPTPGATTTFTQFLQARAAFSDIMDLWNLWQRDQREDELAATTAVFDQWERAEPDFRPWTDQDTAAWERDFDQRRQQERERDERDRLTRVPLHDPERDRARLALLEQQSHLDSTRNHLHGLRERTVYPAMEPGRREREISDSETTLERLTATVARLQELVGDSDTIVDKDGYLPHHRRERHRSALLWWRHDELTRLRGLLADLQTQHTAATDRGARAQLRTQIRNEQHQLDTLADMVKSAEDDMCSECASPASWHLSPYTLTLPKGPCVAWPQHAKRRRELRDWFLAITKNPRTPAPPKPEPLAVIPSGLSIDQLMTRLAELQTQYPDAIVRRGNANKWEFWPPHGTKASTTNV
jgi:hypothetical protein